MDSNNKYRRAELTHLKYLKRLKQLGLKDGEGNFYAFKSHGVPCSCGVCRDEKYKRTKFNLNEEDSN